MTVTRKIFGTLAEIILEGGAKQATKVFSPSLVVKATRKGKRRKGSNVTLLFTVGRPNYAQRQFISKAKRAGEPFPIKKVLLSFDKSKGKRK
jgi:hypothetical protein